MNAGIIPIVPFLQRPVIMAVHLTTLVINVLLAIRIIIVILARAGINQALAAQVIRRLPPLIENVPVEHKAAQNATNVLRLRIRMNVNLIIGKKDLLHHGAVKLLMNRKTRKFTHGAVINNIARLTAALKSWSDQHIMKLSAAEVMQPMLNATAEDRQAVHPNRIFIKQNPGILFPGFCFI